MYPNAFSDSVISEDNVAVLLNNPGPFVNSWRQFINEFMHKDAYKDTSIHQYYQAEKLSLDPHGGSRVQYLGVLEFRIEDFIGTQMQAMAYQGSFGLLVWIKFDTNLVESQTPNISTLEP